MQGLGFRSIIDLCPKQYVRQKMSIDSHVLAKIKQSVMKNVMSESETFSLSFIFIHRSSLIHVFFSAKAT